MSHLKEKSYYEMVFDRQTVDACRRHLKASRQLEESTETSADDQSKKERGEQFVVNYILYFEKGERYLEKNDTIGTWMDRDRIYDEIEATEPYRPVFCEQCHAEMEPSTGVGRFDYDEPRQSRMAYAYFCPRKHFPGKIVYTDGEARAIEPQRCGQCRSANVNDVFDEKTESAVITCADCGHIDRMDLSIKPEPVDPHFERDRALYCLSEQEGEAYQRDKHNLLALKASFDQQEERERNQTLYDAVAKIEKLSIFELESKVRTVLEAAGFADIRFDKAETGQYVVLPFSCQETKADRSGRDGELTVQRELKQTLEPTNWRLMTGGITSKLGQLEGRLKGYDQEEDLLGLVKHRKSTEQTTSN